MIRRAFNRAQILAVAGYLRLVDLWGRLRDRRG